MGRRTLQEGLDSDFAEGLPTTHSTAHLFSHLIERFERMSNHRED